MSRALSQLLVTIDDSRIFTLRSLQDMDRIKAAAAAAQRVVVVGAGFIGLEMAEQFVRLGKTVTLLELTDQVLPPLDRPMTRLLEDELRKHHIDLVLGESVAAFDVGVALTCRLAFGRTLGADLVVLSIGVPHCPSRAKIRSWLIFDVGKADKRTWIKTSQTYMLPMLGSVHSVVFFVVDVDEVAAWYSRLLGFSPAVHRAGFARFKCGETFLSFHEADAKSGEPSGRQVCYWTVTDIDDAIQRFEAQGGSLFRSPIVVEEGARICQVRDPFGCVHGFAQRA